MTNEKQRKVGQSNDHHNLQMINLKSLRIHLSSQFDLIQPFITFTRGRTYHRESGIHGNNLGTSGDM